MERESYTTRKPCKCGQEILISYSLEGPQDMEIRCDAGGEFRSKQWPNYIYCNCGKRHDLTTFKIMAIHA